MTTKDISNITKHIQRKKGYIDINPPEGIWRDFSNLDHERDTIWTCLESNATKYPTKEFLGERSYDATTKHFGDYQWMTYPEALQAATTIGSSLLALDCGLARQDPVAIYSANSREWVLCEFGVLSQGFVLVPLYATFGAAALGYILRQTHLKCVLCSAESLPSLADTVEYARTPEAEAQYRESEANAGNATDNSSDNSIDLRAVVVMRTPPGPKQRSAQELPTPLLERFRAQGVRVVKWTEFEELGRARNAKAAPGRSQEVHSIIYTSGTSGFPKGAVFDNRAWTVTCDKVSKHPALGDPAENVHYSFLPLAHVYEQAFVNVMVRYGASVGFNSGSLGRIMEDVAALRPTFMLGVPRVWKKIYDTVTAAVNNAGFLKRMLFNYAVSARRTAVRTGVPTWIDWNYYVLDAVKAKLGGRVRFVCSGAAPLPPDLNEWLTAVFNVEVIQIYGLTETSGGVLATVHPHSSSNLACVGYACLFGTVRLADCPEMGYITGCEEEEEGSERELLPRGEVQYKGLSLLREYYRRPDLTAEAFTKDGFFCTGDIGQLNADGTVSIIDRKKNLFKLSQGEYIPAELLETTFSHTPLVAQVWIHGDSSESFIVALVVPSFPDLAAWPALPADLREPALAAAKDPRSPAARALCDRAELRRLFLDEITGLARQKNFPHFQYPKAVYLEPVPWDTDNDLCTPTFKLKRNALRAKYKVVIQNLVDEVKGAASSSSSQTTVTADSSKK